MNFHPFRRTLLFAACTFFFFSLASQTLREDDFIFAEYNVENLFDTLRTEGRQDADFTPSGRLHWDTARYRRKLFSVAHAIAALSPNSPPALVALCEVENDSVVRDLCQRTSLARLGYEYVITHSEDVRGINVALLYQPLRFRPVSVDTFRVRGRREGQRPTRDLLHVAGRLVSGDTLDVFVCHLPSRWGGRRQSEPFRREVAQRLRAAVDSIYKERARVGVIIAGDFNDELTNRSLRRDLGASAAQGSYEPLGLYDLCCRGEGTYKYRGRWQHIDHVLLSGTLLLGQHSLQAHEGSAFFVRPDFLLEADGEHALRPHRTYLGAMYLGGTSDHLPTCLRLILRW